MRLILLFLGTILCFQAAAQRFLVLQRSTSPKQQKYVVGDEIAVRLNDDSYELRGELEAIADSSIVIAGQQVALNRITMVLDYRRVRSFRSMAIPAFAAVPFFLVVTAANRGVNTEERPLIDDHTWTMSAIFAGIGLGFMSVGPRKYRIGERWMIRSLDTRFQ